MLNFIEKYCDAAAKKKHTYRATIKQKDKKINEVERSVKMV